MLGSEITVSHFQEGQFIDIQGTGFVPFLFVLNDTRKGKGFAGVMKRHGFHGLRASHGTSIRHRHGGSIGQSQVSLPVKCR